MALKLAKDPRMLGVPFGLDISYWLLSMSDVVLPVGIFASNPPTRLMHRRFEIGLFCSGPSLARLTLT